MPLRTKQPPKSVNCMGVGERGRNRTFNLLIKSQLLCQLSYAPAPLDLTSCSVLRNLGWPFCTDFALTGGSALAASTSVICMAACTSSVLTILYLSNTLLVLRPLIFIATFSGTLASRKFHSAAP